PGPNEFYNDFDALTVLISHETLEAMTDPIDSFAASVPFIGGILNAFLDILDVGPGWYDDNAADLFTNSEAADICESPRNEEVWLNNSLVAAYWSNADNDCAAGPGVVRNFSLNQTGVPPGIPVRVAFDSRTPNVNAGGGFTIQVATNTSHSYSYPSPVAGPTGVRYLTGQPPATVAVTDTFSVTAPYSTQFFLTVGANPPAAGIGNLSLTPSDWHAPGPFTLQADQDVSAGGGIRYDFTSWSGDVSGNTHNLAINLESPTTATANYALQDLVTFNETGIPAGPPWHVMVDGATHAGPFPDFVNNGATVHYSYDVVVPGAPGTCYVLGSITPPSPLTVTAPATVIGAYSTQTTPQAILNYQLAGVQPAAGNQSYVTYSADVVNCGRALTSVTATLTSLDPFTVRVVPGQGTLNFAPVPANSEVTSSNTFTILTNASIPFDFSKLSWAFSPAPAPPIANPGPNQSVAVGSTVTLDGSGSANPSGIGSLTYNWVFVSRPPGSSPALRFSTTPSAQFVANAPGTYVIMLTVSNGMASNSSTVTVTAF
ncbi:MAG TPA: hypothetical protein VKG25_09580, partial [Bryobacteraceae bacterium]|nr:hypothetical protein [Bryobacteraceae bacterium]